MSLNRENVIWQTPDGRWHRGFYDFYETSPEPGEDWDPEWDVEYRYDRFREYKGGFPPEQAASAWQPGANPGGSWHLGLPSKQELAELDRAILWFNDPKKAFATEVKEYAASCRKALTETELTAGQRVRILVATDPKQCTGGGGWDIPGRVVTTDRGTEVISDKGDHYRVKTPTGRGTFVDGVQSVTVQKNPPPYRRVYW